MLNVLGLGVALVVAAGPDGAVYPQWPAGERAAAAAYEAALLAAPNRESLLAYHQLLGSEPHVAGTPGDLRNVERIASAFEGMGLEVQRHEFWALLARPVESALEVIAPEPVKLSTAEAPLPQDSFSGHPDRMMGWNAYSGSGDVTAQVVYANYGTKADFARLAELGVEVKGKIVVARYGGNYRGYKAKFAEEAGAAGVVIYTDPADSGFAKGIEYPEGGYANAMCIERGSINTLGYPGDPLTPGVEATKDAKRLDAGAVELPRIPVQPVGWQAAGEILKRMTGLGVPAGWQGGLPVAYRLSGGEALKVRLMVKQERAIIPSFNVIGVLKGASEPEKWMVVGCHHDAWVCGAADPLAGTIALMEAARAFSEQARAGRRPARSIVFAAWGAEEFGIIGSTEWVEASRAKLLKDAVGYINLDMASMGPDFGASTTPSMRRVVMESARSVPTARAKDGQTVFAAWLGRGEDAAFPGMPRFGEMGGGSDHVGFVCHAGVAGTSLGGSGAGGHSYHSTYDTLPWYWKVVGSDYEPALMVTRMTIAVAGRMAGAPLVPLDVARYGPEMRRHLADLSKRGIEAGVMTGGEGGFAAELAGLAQAAAEFGERAGAVMARVESGVERGEITGEKLARINALLVEADRAWLSEEGIPGRPWFKSLYAATDEDSGYAAWILPALRWGVEHKDKRAVERAAERYAGVLARLGELVGRIEGALEAD